MDKTKDTPKKLSREELEEIMVYCDGSHKAEETCLSERIPCDKHKLLSHIAAVEGEVERGDGEIQRLLDESVINGLQALLKEKDARIKDYKESYTVLKKAGRMRRAELEKKDARIKELEDARD